MLLSSIQGEMLSNLDRKLYISDINYISRKIIVTKCH